MSTLPSHARRSDPPVRLSNSHQGASGRRLAPGRTAKRTKIRVTGWITRSIMLATTAFAVLDLLLLATGGHR
jgi:hypothetical protein